VTAINALSTIGSEKMVSREEVQHPAKVLPVVVDSLASVDSLVAEIPISRLPRVREDLGVDEAALHLRILKRFSSKFFCFHFVSDKHN
jgi:hypothetical protein